MNFKYPHSSEIPDLPVDFRYFGHIHIFREVEVFDRINFTGSRPLKIFRLNVGILVTSGTRKEIRFFTFFRDLTSCYKSD